jgi:hypothetical protein
MKLMKLDLRAKRNRGSAFLISLILVGIMSFAMASYLALIRTHSYATMRSLAWNTGIPVAEAGIEEALTHLCVNGLVATDGWELVQGLYLMKTRVIEGGECIVGISMTDPPVIVAEAKTQAPLCGQTISRTVRVRTKRNSLFQMGMVARLSINLNGNYITVDSYDSADPEFSTNGRYDPNKRKDNGTVATNSGDPDMFSAGNANIWGKVATGPGGLVSIGPNSCIGNSAWHEGNNKGLQPDAATDDMNMCFFPLQYPLSSPCFEPGGGTIDGVYYDHILDNGDYVITSSKGFGGKVYVRGKARLHVTSKVQFTGSDGMTIAPGGKLELYVSAKTASIGGLGVQNDTGDPANFIYFGLPTNTSLSYSGNAAISGCIYAPDADLSLGGGGQNEYDFSGACVTRSVSINGKFNFHYDENLGKNALTRGYIATSWDEIRVRWTEILEASLDLGAIN